MITSKIPSLTDLKSIMYEDKIRCAVEDTGKNSVSPSTIPKDAALSKSTRCSTYN